MTRPPADQAVRDRVVRDVDTKFVLEAGAGTGTGRTTVLVSRILALVKTGRASTASSPSPSPRRPRASLKLRLREGLEDAIETTKDEAERERLRTAATDLDRAPVSTIHAFAQALLKERPFEAGLDPGSYQQVGARWLRLLSRLGLGACLADDMGLGKTIQVLALLVVAGRRSEFGGPTQAGGQAPPHTPHPDETRPSLLVAPASLLANWASEASRFAPGLKVLVAHPSALPAAELREISARRLETVDLVVTSYASC